MKKKLIFIDAETDGLYGHFLSVALKVVDGEGNIEASRYWGVKKEYLDNVQTEWVRKNVLPIMGNYEECDDETELLQKVWSFWSEYKENAYMVADVMYPVEARLMSRCVELNMSERCFEAPFPLLDLSAMLFAKGIDPLKNRYELLGERTSERIHNPMEDIDTAIAVWKKYIAGR